MHVTFEATESTDIWVQGPARVASAKGCGVGSRRRVALIWGGQVQVMLSMNCSHLAHCLVRVIAATAISAIAAAAAAYVTGFLRKSKPCSEVLCSNTSMCCEMQSMMVENLWMRMIYENFHFRLENETGKRDWKVNRFGCQYWLIHNRPCWWYIYIYIYIWCRLDTNGGFHDWHLQALCLEIRQLLLNCEIRVSAMEWARGNE